MNKCLCCYRPLKNGEVDFHRSCAKGFFGTASVPVMDYTLEQIDQLAAIVIEEQTSLTGVQPKLSLHLNTHRGSSRLTIVGLWGNFICKPQTSMYVQMPEVEDLTMHMAEVARIKTVPHSLMRMADGSLCYLTRRIDRTENGDKLAMEDMCQLTERQTEYKYKSSYERVGKTIMTYSSAPILDVTNFFEIVLFSWLTGNNDMHLKNFSLYEPREGKVVLAPAYDMINAAIINPKDDEELALTLNGKKKNFKKTDFLQAASTMGLDPSIAQRIIDKFVKLLPALHQCIDDSFLSDELQEDFHKLLDERVARLQ